MKRIFIEVLLCMFPLFSLGQFQVGHTTVTFNDAARTGGYGSGGGAGRQIQTEIYYPATVAGEDVQAANGTFPVVVFGHGFVMSWDAYDNIWNLLAGSGYVVAFPRTEGSVSPDHNEFALDLALCVTKLQGLNTDGTSLLFGHIAPASAIAGHSMGGGATILASANNTTIQALVGLAPAETNPSAIAAASNVDVPALIMSGSADGVTVPADNHIPIYNNLNSSCKYFISVTGGGHCYFANSNFNCDFGESVSSTGISITRAQQQAVMNDYLVKWLDYTLKADNAAKTGFDNLLDTDSRVTYMESCVVIPTSVSENEIDFELFPNPAGEQVYIRTDLEIQNIEVYDITGNLQHVKRNYNSDYIIMDISALDNGTYIIKCRSTVGSVLTKRMMIMR